jgi:serine/threonine-protein kinase
MAEALGGLHYAHTRADAEGKPLQIVHRDVSPQNIMISHEGEVKLVDFGIAKAELSTHDQTQHGIIKGKFYYMSPEQAYGHHIDARTDIFAAGMVLYELLAGRNPYQGIDEAQLLKAVRQADFAPIFATRPDIAPELVEIITRATRRDAQHRFESAREMQAALVDYLDRLGEPYRRMELARYVRALVGGGGDRDGVAMSRVDYEANEASMIFEPGSSLHDELAELEAEDEENPFREEEPTRLWGAEGPKPPGHIRDNPGHIRGNMVRAEAPSPGFAPPPGAIPPPANAASMRRTTGPMRRAPTPMGTEPRKETSQTTLPLFERLIPPQFRKPPIIFGAFGLVALVLCGVLFALVSGGTEESAASSSKSAALNPAGGAPAANSAAAGEAAPAAATVDIRVISQPSGARVYVDGDLAGTTPFILKNLSIRKAHKVSVTHRGYETLKRTVQPTAETNLLEFELHPVGGVLKVTTYPTNAEVRVDGRLRGRSPVDVAGLARSETHEVVATLDDGREVRRSVKWDDSSGRVMQIALNFEQHESQKEEQEEDEAESRRDDPPRRRRPRRKRSRKPSRSEPIDLFSDEKKTEKVDPNVLNIWGD